MNNILNPLPLYEMALKKSMPDLMVRDVMKVEDNKLITGQCEVVIDTHINILAYGKASILMYLAAREIVGENFFRSGLLITHQDPINVEIDPEKEIVLQHTHPFMTQLSCKAGAQVKNFVESHDCRDILLVLVSGGGSAMVSLPARGVKLEEKIEFITNVMHTATPEREVTILKKALSDIKGGKLAEATKDKCILNFILSDERNHQFKAISSGMTVYNDHIDPIPIMDKYDLWEIASDNIKRFLREHGRKTDVGANKVIYNHLVGSRDNLVDSIKCLSDEFGFNSVFLMENIHSCTPEEAVDILQSEFSRIYESAPSGRHLVVSTGEIQVKVPKREHVKGGRNQHLVALFMIKNILSFDHYFVAVATDGMDYLEGVHGAFCNNEMLPSIKKNRPFIKKEIKKNNTYVVHKKLGSLLEGEKTGTNISDFILFTFQKI